MADTHVTRYLINKLRRFKRYLHGNRVRDVVSVNHTHDLSLINVYSISPLIVNLCAKNLLFLLGLDCRVGSWFTIGFSRIKLENMYGSKSRILSNMLYSIQIEISVTCRYDTLVQITCKRLINMNYNPDLLPLELLDVLAENDPLIAIRFIL
ncbi:hypothetical protein PRJ_Fausto_00269 [Faustovirus]|nr:hypothetical protein PRJ_Fausto_00269 [Faustovirus]QBR99177.1 hypothetical protein [Faustovirus mariensis]